MPIEKEIVELIVQAKDLSSKELNEAATAVQKLGKAADRTKEELDQLTINEANLQRFIELKDEINQLEKTTDELAASNKNFSKSVKESGTATKKQTIELEKNKRVLSEQKSELRKSKTEYDKLEKTLKEAGVNTRTFNRSLKNTSKQLKASETSLSKINAKYDESIVSLKQLTAEEIKSRDAKRQKIGLLQEEAIRIDKVVTAEKEAHSINERLIRDAKEKATSDKLAAQASNKKAIEDAKLLQINNKINKAKKQQIEIQKQKSKQDKLELDRIKKLNKAHTQAIIENNKLTEAKKKQVRLDRQATVEAERTAQALKKYQIEIEKLNAQFKKGKISKEQFIKSEKKLRRELKLTEKQAKRTGAALASSKGLGTRKKSTDSLTKATRRLAQAYTVLLVAQNSIAAVGAAVKGYGELESAITKVEKTTDLTKDQLVQMSEQLQVMATDVTPTATNELLRFAEIAGQLGAESSEDILRMVSAADALGLSTNLAGEEAVTLLARMLKMSGEGLPAINNLSSSIVELGNTFAVSESELASMTKEILTGTTSIKLGSAAAAGFAATLKEMGQTGERSRSSLFKLSQAIKSAAVNGGQDLENLSRLTKLAGDQIDESLGKKPEEVLIAFVEGLKDIKDQGGLVSEELRKFGITGVEATSVIEVLADKTERLKEAVNASNQAYIDGDKHINEAVKAYANQDAKIGRLVNKFTELKASIGGAFADETNSVVDSLSKSIDNQSESIIAVIENLSDFGESVLEQLGSLDDLAESLGVFDAVGFVLLQIKKTFNDIQILNDKAIIGILELRKWWNALSRDSEEFIELVKKQEEIEERIARNRQDRANAVARINGQSSASYEDLLEVVKDNADAVENLTKKEKEQIAEATKLLGFKEGQDKAYRDLTESIIEQIRTLEAEAEINKELSENDKKELKAKQEKIDKQRELNSLTDQAVRNNGDLSGKIEALTFSLKEGFISQTEYSEKLKQINSAQKLSIPILKEIAEKNKDIAQSNKEVVSQSADLAESIRKQKIELKDLNDKMKNTLRTQDDYKDKLFEISKATKELAEDEKKLAVTRDLEKKTLSELLLIQSQHVLEVEKLELAYKSGRISLEEYNLQSADLAFKTQFLNQAIGENTSVIEQNKIALDKSNEALQERISLMRESLGLDSPDTEEAADDAEDMAAAVSLWAIAQNRLNKELDFTDLTIDELHAKSAELETEWRHLRATAGGWWDDLHRLNNQAVRREQQIIKETVALKKLEEKVASGALSADELDRAATRAVFSFKNLGDEQLRPLREAIRDAKAEFQDLQDTINDSFADTQDRLDALLGNEQDIVKRRFQRELDELLGLLDQARQSGDQGLVRTINEAIRNLKEAQKLEFDRDFGTKNTGVNSGSQQSQPQQQGGFGSGSRNEVTVTLNLNGTASTFDFATQNDADAFVTAMEALQEVNTAGIG